MQIDWDLFEAYQASFDWAVAAYRKSEMATKITTKALKEYFNELQFEILAESYIN